MISQFKTKKVKPVKKIGIEQETNMNFSDSFVPLFLKKYAIKAGNVINGYIFKVIAAAKNMAEHAVLFFVAKKKARNVRKALMVFIWPHIAPI